MAKAVASDEDRSNQWYGGSKIRAASYGGKDLPTSRTTDQDNDQRSMWSAWPQSARLLLRSAWRVYARPGLSRSGSICDSLPDLRRWAVGVLTLPDVPTICYTPIMTPITDQIRAMMRTSGLSQREIAARSGVSLSIITAFLGGKSITTRNLYRIYQVVSKKSLRT